MGKVALLLTFSAACQGAWCRKTIFHRRMFVRLPFCLFALTLTHSLNVSQTGQDGEVSIDRQLLLSLTVGRVEGQQQQKQSIAQIQQQTISLGSAADRLSLLFAISISLSFPLFLSQFCCPSLGVKKKVRRK